MIVPVFLPMLTLFAVQIRLAPQNGIHSLAGRNSGTLGLAIAPQPGVALPAADPPTRRRRVRVRIQQKPEVVLGACIASQPWMVVFRELLNCHNLPPMMKYAPQDSNL